MDDTDSGNQRARVLRVATRCTTADQFVEAFARFCDGRSLFVSSLSTRPIGTRLPFVILLADGSRAMRGQCEVVESHATPGNVYRRPGVKLALTDLDEESEAMLGRLQAARAARDARLAPAASGAALEVPGEGGRAAKAPTTPPPTSSRTSSPGTVPPPTGTAEPEPATPASSPSAAPALPASSPSAAPAVPAPPAAPQVPAPLAAPAVPAPVPPPLRPLPRAAGRVPALPPLPRLEPRKEPAPEPHAGDRRATEVAEPRRVSSASIPPPPTDAPDAGWSDDEVRSVRLVAPSAEPAPALVAPAIEVAASPVPVAIHDPVEAPPSPVAASPAPDDESAPAVIVAAPPASEPVGAADDVVVDAVPVVELISRSQSQRRETSRMQRASSSMPVPQSERSARASRASGAPRSASSDNPMGEERTPGSSFILPANPFSNLTDESLQGFIDCTLYEDTAPEEPVSDPAISGSELGLVEEPEPDFRPLAAELEPVPSVVGPRHERSRGLTPPPEPRPEVPGYVAQAVEAVRKRAQSQQLTAIDDDDDDEEDDLLPPAPPPVEPRRAARPTPPPPMPLTRSEPHRVSRPTPPPLPPLPRAEPASAPDWLAPSPAAKAATAVAPAAARPGRGRLWLALIVLGGLAAAGALYLRGRDGKASGGAVASAPRDAGAPPVDAAVAALAVDAAVNVDAAEPPPIDAGATAVGTTCRLQVTTTPAGAAVSLGKQSLGTSPVDAEVPCGAGTLSVRLTRFQPHNQAIELVAGKPSVHRLKLARVMHNLTVISSPRGATIIVDGKPAGVTSTTIQVTGFVKHSLVLEKAGYKTHRTTVTTSDKEQTVAVPLVKE